jgi:hypothetical protein
MVDSRTGLPFTEQGLLDALEDVFKTIRSDGANKLDLEARGSRSLANSRGDARFLVFSDAEGWMAYSERFGGGTPYDAMVGHIEGMARDIAALEILGPNPNATVDWLKNLLKKEAGEDLSPGTKLIDQAKTALVNIDNVWAEYTGAAFTPKRQWLANVGSSYRSLATARFLGSATISAVSDAAFVNARLKFNGLSRRTALGEYLKLMVPGSVEEQKFMIRRGFIAEEYANRTAAHSRYVFEEHGSELAKRFASGVIRLSLLARHTQMDRWAYQASSLATFTEQVGKSFAKLHPKLRGALERYGIDAAGWEKLRRAPMDTDRGIQWISPHNLKGEDRAIGDRFMEMIYTETDAAVPVPDLKTRSIVSTHAQRGTFIGEGLRSGPLMFRSFGISVLLRQMSEIRAMQPGTIAAYAGGLFITTTMMGAVALQLRELVNGRDPRPMGDGKFWLAAIQQGGGFGIFGDLLFSTESRTGNGVAMTAAGVAPQDLDKLIRTAGNPESNLVRTTKNWLPGNNLWYTRAAFDRMVADQIEEAVNPDIRASRKRLFRYAQEQGTDFWWEPGEMAPERAPDFANAFEEGPEERERR